MPEIGPGKPKALLKNCRSLSISVINVTGTFSTALAKAVSRSNVGSRGESSRPLRCNAAIRSAGSILDGMTEVLSKGHQISAGVIREANVSLKALRNLSSVEQSAPRHDD